MEASSIRRTPVILSAVTLVAAFGLSGCFGEQTPAPSSPTTTTAVGAAPDQAALPPPEALAGVISTLADPSVPVEQKVGLVQYGTVDDQPTLQNFGKALADGGFVPATVKATDLKWSTTPGDVAASITITAPNDAISPFTYPMEFSPMHETWQLARRSADQLLPLATPSVTTPVPTPP